MIHGSIEIQIMKSGQVTSVGKPVQIAQPADVMPMLVAMGYSEVAHQAPETRTGGQTPVGAWSAVAPGGYPATVRLWRELPFEETALGKALASGAINWDVP